jgi:hypothetical protein
MPNWCSNVAILDFTNADPQAEAVLLSLFPVRSGSYLKRALSGDEETEDWGFFNAYIPMPPELRTSESSAEGHARDGARLKRLYGAKDWYDWAVKNWGTKWDVTPYVVEVREPGVYRICFDTAWGPALSFFRELAEEWGVTSNLYYCESGEGFIGYARDGVELEAYDYPFDGESYNELLAEVPWIESELGIEPPEDDEDY